MPPNSAKGLNVHTTHYYFLLEGKCVSSREACARRLWQDGKGKSAKRSSVEAVLWGMRRTFFLRFSHLCSLLRFPLAHRNHPSEFLILHSVCLKLFSLPTLFLCRYLCGESIVWQSSRLTHFPVVCFLQSLPEGCLLANRIVLVVTTRT